LTVVVPPAASDEKLEAKVMVCGDLAVKVNGTHDPETLVLKPVP
jgi:hypothetical protein